MKSYLPFAIFLTMLLSYCGTSTNNENISSEKETNDIVEPTTNENFLTLNKWDSLSGEEKCYYIINYSGVNTEEEAITMVESLQQDYPNSGYLWIPDFASLSGKEMYAVFLDQHKYMNFLEDKLQEGKAKHPNIYMVRVNQNKERWEVYSPIDIRIDGEKQKMILIYAKPEELDEYFEQGGEDWIWFVNDVSTYFEKNHPDIYIEYVYSCSLPTDEINKLEKESAAEGFGYILMNGSELVFISHDLPDGVIVQACNFFGFKYE